MYRDADGLEGGGIAGNARLTGSAAVVLLLLLAAEGATIPFIGQLLGPHIFIGVLLIPPVVVKMGSTGYRFVRYYLGQPGYRLKGPPPVILRLLAPGVVLTTVILFATGVALLYVGPNHGLLLLAHKASFIAWFALMAVHVLGHLLELPDLALPDWRRHAGREGRLAGAGPRMALVSGSLLTGVALALAALSLAGPWLSQHGG
jgi:hypothetical protein